MSIKKTQEDKIQKIYDETLHDVSLDELAEERTKTTSVYYELLKFVKNLSIGVDLTKITSPIFIIRPVSFLELFSEYAEPSKELLNISSIESPEERMFVATKYFVSSSFNTIRDSLNMVKPYNPIVGEQFKCSWKLENSETNFFSEQISHHPPVSGCFMENKQKNIKYNCTVEARAHFHGNYAENSIIGETTFEITNLGEIYKVEFPKTYIKGIFFGSAGIENSGSLKITCEKTKLKTEVNFKYGNTIEGFIKNEKEKLYQFSGSMRTKVDCINLKNQKNMSFGKPPKVEKFIEKIKNQKSNESRKLWYSVTEAIIKGDNDVALKEKTKIEQLQREYLSKNKHEVVWFSKTKRIVDKVPIYEFNE
eukprot:gene6687-10852_t